MEVSDERLKELVRWTSKAGMPDVHQLLMETERHRAAVAADKERIKAVVLDALAYHTNIQAEDRQWDFDDIAARAADQIATAAPALPSNAVRGLVLIRRSHAEGGHNWSAGTDAADVKAAFAWIESLRPVATTAITADRITDALAKLGAEHEPPTGWDARVLAALPVDPRRLDWYAAEEAARLVVSTCAFAGYVAPECTDRFRAMLATVSAQLDVIAGALKLQPSVTP